jgi:hypothetical protein
LEAVVSDQLHRELLHGVTSWLESRGVTLAPGVLDLNVDPLIGYSESPVYEPEIKRVIVEVNFAEYFEESLLAGVVGEVSSLLKDRGYVFKKTVDDKDDPRPLAHVEVNAPAQSSLAAATVSIPVAETRVDMRRALTGATFTVLTAIILLFAFVLRQIRIPNSIHSPPEVNNGDPMVLSKAPTPFDVLDAAALERGKSLRIGGSLALMNFDQAISFLAKLDRVHRKAVLARLPVHSSIKVRLMKALAHKPLVNTTR